MPVFLSVFVETYLLGYGVKILGAIILLLVGFALIKALTKLLRSEKTLKKLDPTVRSFMASFINIALKLLLVLSAVIIIGVPSASVLALLGSCGLALGLALQGGLGNLAGGVLILLLKPYKLGDYISCPGGEGTVSEIGIFYSTLLTVDNTEIVVPNGSMSSTVIKNYSTAKLRRIDLDFEVAAGEELDKVRGIIAEVANADQRIISEPPYDIIICALSASSVTFRIRAWCENSNYWNLYYDLMESIKRAFIDDGVKAPVQKMRIENM